MKIIFSSLILVMVLFACRKEDYGSPGVRNASLTIIKPVNFSLAGTIMQCSSTTDLSDTRYTYGFCYSTTNRLPVIPGLATGSSNYDGNGFSAAISKLEYGEKYYIRAFVTNGLVTTYSNVDSFVMPDFIAVSQVKNITSQTFSVDIRKLPSITGAITEWGICFGKTAKPDSGDFVKLSPSVLPNMITMNIDDSLSPGVTYYLRSYIVSNDSLYYSNEVSFKTAGYKGIAGGYVFFDKGDTAGGWRYLEAVPDTALFTGISWGCSGTNTTAVERIWGSGYSNTVAILSACTTVDIAAAVCDSLVFKTKTDWYLPSVDELKALYKLKSLGLTTMSSTILSSTQASSTDCFAIDFSNGIESSLSKGSTFGIVWPVRRFL